MTDQQEFDRLRQTFSGALQQLISESQKTKLQMQQLNLPVSLELARRFADQRRAEAEARDAYVVASNHLPAFVQQHLYIIN